MSPKATCPLKRTSGAGSPTRQHLPLLKTGKPRETFKPLRRHHTARAQIVRASQAPNGPDLRFSQPLVGLRDTMLRSLLSCCSRPWDFLIARDSRSKAELLSEPLSPCPYRSVFVGRKSNSQQILTLTLIEAHVRHEPTTSSAPSPGCRPEIQRLPVNPHGEETIPDL